MTADCGYMQKTHTKNKNKTTNKMLQSSFTIFAHVFLTISGRFCVKHMSKSSACQTQTLVRASTWTQATAAAAILESAADPNLTSEKVMGEICAMVHIPDSWHVYSQHYLTSFDQSTKSTSPHTKSYRYFYAVFTSRQTIFRPTSLTISGATWASTRPRPIEL